MDEKKNSLSIIFIIFVAMVYLQWAFAPAPAPDNHPANSQVVTPVAQVEGTMTPIQMGPNGAQPVNTVVTRPSLVQLKQSEQTVINTGNAIFTINHLGARVQSVKLKSYKAKLKDDSPLEMINTKDGSPLPLGVYADGVSDDFVLYTLDQSSLPTINGGIYDVTSQPTNFVFVGQLSTQKTIRKILTFKPNSYDMAVNIQLDGPSADGAPIQLEWSHVIPSTELPAAGMQKKIIVFGEDNKLHSTFVKDIKPGVVDAGSARWIALTDYYFLEGIISSSDKGAATHTLENEAFIVRMAGNAAGGSFVTYAGPKDIETLKGVGHALERSVDLGMFSFLAHPILAMMKFFYHFLHNYGLSIILLTLLIKLAFLPLTQSSFKSMQAMQELQPEIQALRERIEDQNILNQELMSLYKKRGVNPLGGCLPMLIQIPVFLGLYNALLNSIELRHEPFALWINDLSAPEHLDLFGFGVPLMILIMGGSMMVQQWTQPSAMDPQQKKIMMMMPFIFTFMFIIHPMPSGLVLYWLVNNLISIVQQKYIRGHKGASPLVATGYASLAIFLFGFVLTLL